MSLTAGHRQRVIRPRCYECNASGPTHPYPKESASEHQRNGSVAGGYDWLCGECVYLRDHPEATRAQAVARMANRPPQKERLFELD